MEFQRARNENQKQVRVKQILDAADGLLEEYPYHKITLAMIANKLDFSRANMSRYMATKEEIFLLLFLDNIEQLTKQLETNYLQKGSMNITDFSHFFAFNLSQYAVVLKINAILNTIVEINISAEKLAVYKKEMFVQLDKIGTILVQNFVFISPLDAGEIIKIVIEYIAGLYPSTKLSIKQKQAIKISGVNYREKDFTESFAQFLKVLLHGCQSLKQTDNLNWENGEENKY